MLGESERRCVAKGKKKWRQGERESMKFGFGKASEKIDGGKS
jgi:hypothetical protein